MVEDEIERRALQRIENWLGLIFPGPSAGWPNWKGEPWKGDLFTIFAETYPRMRLHGNRIQKHLEDRWGKDRSDKEWNTVLDILAAWSEWLYAWDKHPEAPPCQGE
jgi:hypothetical protein